MQQSRQRIFSIYHGRFPGEKAASLFAAKEAESFAELNFETILVVPKRLGRIKTDPYTYYHIEKKFNIVFLPTLDLFFLPFKKLSFFISYIFFSFSSFLYLLFRASKQDWIYSNELVPLGFASLWFSRTAFTLHDFPESKLKVFAFFLNRFKKIIVHNKWKLKKIQELMPKIPHSKMMYEPNAVDVREFDISDSQQEARKKLKLPEDEKMAAYTGHLYSWKGVDVLAEAAGFLLDFSVYFIGGTDADVERFKNLYATRKNIHIIGQRPHLEIPLWQKAADVLVLPNTAKEKISLYYTSPMKLFEYMASRRPIVASQIPSLEELLNSKNAILIPPDDPKMLAEGIRRALTSGAAYSDQAYRDVLNHTWQKRAERILNFVLS